MGVGICTNMIRKRIFVDTVSTNKNYTVDTVSTNKNYAVDTLRALCMKSALCTKNCQNPTLTQLKATLINKG